MYGFDFTKITVCFKELGLTGAEAEKILRYDYKIQAELADVYNVLFIISIGDDEKSVQTLLDALKDIANKFKNKEKLKFKVDLPNIPPKVVLPQDAFYATKNIMKFSEAAGTICGEKITFYPPGIPIICSWRGNNAGNY